MADDSLPSPSDALPPPTEMPEASPTTASEPQREAAVLPRTGPMGVTLPAPDRVHGPDFERTWAQLALGWLIAVVLFGLLVFIFHSVFSQVLSSVGGFVVRFGIAFAVVAAYTVFYLLEKNFWLSRVLGLQTGPNRSALHTLVVSLSPIAPPAPAAESPATTPETKTKPTDEQSPKDLFREIAETVVFVIVLVLLLRTFVAEAFVIPTGSMATTLWGYQKIATCPECGFTFPVNASSEADPQREGEGVFVSGATCPNCRNELHFNRGGEPVANTGDRVLVMKCLYDTGLRPPKRGDVVVFKFPGNEDRRIEEPGPEKDQQAINYIKRLCGLPGETIALHGGKLYVCSSLDYSWKPKDEQPAEKVHGTLVDARHRRFMYVNDPKAVEAFLNRNQAGTANGFQIFRKPPGQVMAMRRPVYDNDFQRKDRPVRWEGETDWQGADDPQHPKAFNHPAGTAGLAWLRYRHRLTAEPELITDFMGYNSAEPQRSSSGGDSGAWVGDLMLECTVDVTQAAGEDEVCLELSKGVDRFRAHFKLATGDCTLGRVVDGKEETLTEGDARKMAVRPSNLKGTGRHSVRFANVDERLLVWVDDALVFGDGVPYSSPQEEGPTNNDLQPASVGARGAGVKVSGLKLWRDTYYICNPAASGVGRMDESVPDNIRKNPADWAAQHLRAPVMTMYVQPGHYLCLGDNSPQSSDSRVWGLVPDRLLLGRALAVYFPFYLPPFLPVNRVGPID